MTHAVASTFDRERHNAHGAVACPSDHRRAVIAGCAPPVLVAVNFALVSVAARDVARDLALTPGAIAWAFSAYNLVLGCLLLPCGRIADVHGCRRVLLAGLAVFAAGVAATATAGSGVALVVGRCMQGAGAALMTPAALALLTTATPPGPVRRRALRRYGIAMSVGFVAGTLVSGALTTLLGWRLAVTCALAPISFAAVAVGGVPAGAGRGPQDRRTGLWRLARTPHLHAACAAGFVVTGTGVGGTLLLTLQLQGPLGLSPLSAGALFACFGVAALPGAWLAARLEARSARRGALIAGLGTQGTGLLLACAVATGGSTVLVALAIAVFGTGHVIGNVGAATAATDSVSRAAQGEAAGVLSIAQCLGAALGPALLGRVASTSGGFAAGIGIAGATAVIAAAALAVPSRARSCA